MSAIRVGFGFGVGLFSVVTVGSRHWALIVPVALTLFAACAYGVPYAALAYVISKRRYGLAAFAATACIWSLCMDLGEQLNFPTKAEGLAAVSSVPFLMRGARLFGCNVACGVLVAGTIGTGVLLAVPSSRTLRLTLIALRPTGSSLALLALGALLATVTASKASGTLMVGVPQMNVQTAYYVQRQALPRLADAFDDLFSRQLDELAGIDLLAMTETYDGAFPLLIPKVRQRFERYARLQNQGVLLTSYLPSDSGGIYNAVGAISNRGRLVGVHRKVDLAPFGEVEYEAGTSYAPLPVLQGVRVGALICQESGLVAGAYSLVRQGANLLVSPTSDASFGSGLMSFEHLAFARMRSIETGRSLVWASASGPSGAIDRWGQFTAGARFREPGAARIKVDLHEGFTPYLRSLWVWRLVAVLGAIGFAVTGRPSIHPRPSASASGTIAGFAHLFVSLPAVWGLCILSAGAVELANGTPERARRSMVELLHHSEPYLGESSLERFRSSIEGSASGAIAFMLESYGQRSLPAQVYSDGRPNSLLALSDALQSRQALPMKQIDVDFDSAPRIPTLVRSNAGEFCVATSDRAHRVWLFRPTEARVVQLSADEARAQLEPVGLVPDVRAALHE